MATIDKKIKIYDAFCKSAVNEAKATIFSGTGIISMINVKVLYDKLSSNLTVLKELTVEYLSKLSDSGDDEGASSDPSYDETFISIDQKVSEYSVVLYQLKEIIDNDVVVTNPTSNPEEQQGRFDNRIKLPTLTLPTFDGVKDEWVPFWESFDSNINSRKDFRPIDKFSYLKGLLRDQALSLISGISLSNENYPIVVDFLTKSYANPDKLRWDAVFKLIDLKSPSNSLEELKDFRTKLEQIVRGLEGLKVDVESADWIIAPVIFRKLPYKVKEQIQLRCNTDFPSISDIREGLTKTVCNLASHVTISNSTSNNNVRSKNDDVHKPKFGQSNNNYNKYNLNKTDVTNLNVSVDNKAKSHNCCFCFSEKHGSFTCSEYQTADTRIARLDKLNRCTRCTSDTHSVDNCKVHLRNCFKCKGEHHTALCNTQNHVIVQHSSVKNTESRTILPTAMLNVIKGDQSVQQVRCLFDQCSQCTFVTQHTADKLNLKIIGSTEISITGFLKSNERTEYKIVLIPIKINEKDIIEVRAIVVSKLPETIKTKGLSSLVSKLKSSGVQLADPYLNNDTVDNIEILIGGDYYFRFIHTPRIEGVNLIKSVVGDLIAGQIKSESNPTQVLNGSILVMRLAVDVKSDPLIVEPIPNSSVQEAVSKVGALETIGISDSPMTPEEEIDSSKFSRNIQLGNGRYEVSLPGRVSHKELPSNYNLCQKRFNTTVYKSPQVEGHKEIYNKLKQDQLELGFIEKVPAKELNLENVHHLPHLTVTKESVTTPMRLEFDASASLNKQAPSLNDCLYPGPAVNSQLQDTLLEFRIDKYAISAD